MPIQPTFVSGGGGANYHYLTMGREDEPFFEGAKCTQWKQKWNKYTPHQAQIVVQPLSNSGLGKTMSCNLMKLTDYLLDCWTVQKWAGIAPNTDAGVTKSSWINAKALWSILHHVLKVAAQPMFKLDGNAQLVMMELNGDTEMYASMIGYYFTKNQLIVESKYDVYHFAPWYGFPFHDRPDRAFGIGGIAYHQVSTEIVTRSVEDCVVNYNGVITKGKGMSAMPLRISNGKPVDGDAVEFTLATNCVWVSPAERFNLVHGYNETIFDEHIVAGEFSIAPHNQEHKIEQEINIKGPCTWIAITIIAREDKRIGNILKGCDNYGRDYIKEIMLLTGTTAREDSLPAPFNRIAKPISVFKNGIRRFIYLFAFMTNGKSKQFTGHQNMTNAEKLKIAAILHPHDDTLDFRVDANVLNAYYTERGAGGRIWN